MSLVRVEVTVVPAAAADVCETALAPWCSVVVRTIEDGTGGIRLTGWLAAAAPPQAPAAIATGLAIAAAAAGITPPLVTMVPVTARDWLADNREQFRPFRLGRFFIQGGDDRIVPPAGLVPLTLDAGLAFGSGRHASTAGCLLALADPRVARPREPVLDIGCGSGVLAIAAAKLWRGSVLATDIDPVAVTVAGANARLNGVADRVCPVVADGSRHPRIRAGAPYALILANILARPLIRLAATLAPLSRPGTRLVLAGFVATDAGRVAAAYAGYGFRRLRRIDQDGWTTLVLVRRGKS